MNPAASLPFSPASPAHADEESPGPGELVTVGRVFDPLEAETLRGCLESEGIPTTLGDARTVQTDTLLTVALGGIRVMVPASFAHAARQTLEAIERGALAIDELPPDSPPALPEPEPAAPPRLSRAAWVVLAVVILAVAIF